MEPKRYSMNHRAMSGGDNVCIKVATCSLDSGGCGGKGERGASVDEGVEDGNDRGHVVAEMEAVTEAVTGVVTEVVNEE